VQDGQRPAPLAARRQGAAEGDPGGDGGRVQRAKHAFPVLQDPPRAAHRVGCLSRRQQRVGQLPGREQRVVVVGAEQPLAAGGDILPPGDRRAGQPRGSRALPGRQ
jgi:hypothetical protein